MGQYDTQELIVCELGTFTITAELYYSHISKQWQPRVHLITKAGDRTLSPQLAADLGTGLIRAAERIHEMAQEVQAREGRG